MSIEKAGFGGLTLAAGIFMAITGGHGIAMAESSDPSTSDGPTSTGTASGTPTAVGDESGPVNSLTGGGAGTKQSTRADSVPADNDRGRSSTTPIDQADSKGSRSNRKQSAETPPRGPVGADSDVPTKHVKAAVTSRNAVDRVSSARDRPSKAGVTAKSADTVSGRLPGEPTQADNAMAAIVRPLVVAALQGVGAAPVKPVASGTRAQAVASATPRSVTSRLLSAVGIAPDAADEPGAPTDSPLPAALLAFTRREIDKLFYDDRPVVDPVSVSRSADGVITGTLNAFEPDGDRLSYRVTTQPTGGVVSVDATGAFVYQPDVARASDSGTDNFVVTVTDTTRVLGFIDLPRNRVAVPVTVVRGDTPPQQRLAASLDSYDAATGVATGSVYARDIDGDAITYRLQAPLDPAVGAVDVDPATGRWTFIPTASARQQALDTATVADDFVPFAIVADGVESPSLALRSAALAGRPVALAAAATSTALPVSAPLTQNYVVTRLQNNAHGAHNVTYHNVTLVPTASSPVAPEAYVIPLSAGFPNRVAASPDGRRVYVTLNNTTNTQPGTLQVIDTAANEVIASVTVGAVPTGLVVSPDSSRVYVANRGGPAASSGSISVINTATNTRIATIPNVARGSVDSNGLAISPDGTRLYSVDSAVDSGGRIVVIDTTTNAVTATINTGDGHRRTNDVALSSDGKTLFVTGYGEDGGAVTVIDTTSNTVVTRILVNYVDTVDAHTEYATLRQPGLDPSNAIPQTTSVRFPRPAAVTISPDGRFAYVSTLKDVNSTEDGPMFVIDTATRKVTHVLTDPADGTANSLNFARQPVISNDGTKVFFVDRNGGFYTLDTATLTSTRQPAPATPGFARSIALSRNGNVAYTVSYTPSNKLSSLVVIPTT